MGVYDSEWAEFAGECVADIKVGTGWVTFNLTRKENNMLILMIDWRRGQQEDREKELIALFADDERAPFSIHRFVRHGELACGKPAGEWFGPSAAARCIQYDLTSLFLLSHTNGDRKLCEDYPEAGLRVYMNGDGNDVYNDAFHKIAYDSDGVFHPTLVLVAVRLGIDRVTPVYWEALKATLQMPQSVGIAGYVLYPLSNYL